MNPRRSRDRFPKFFFPVLFSAARNLPEFCNISHCLIRISFKLIKLYFMQQNSENRDKTFQKLCPDIDRFWPNVRRSYRDIIVDRPRFRHACSLNL